LVRRLARHFSEKPPVQFEILQTADHQPQMVVTNLHPYPLTAFMVRTDPAAPNSITNTLVFDALTHVGLLAPIPRGLSLVMGVPHPVGRSVPDPVLAAAVWEDRSSYGPDEPLARIPRARKALADSYDRTLAMLQTGLDKNWNAAEYSAAARQLRLPIEPVRPAVPGSTAADGTPLFNITVNMDRMARDHRPARMVDSVARSLLTHFTQERDALRPVPAESIRTPTSQKPDNRSRRFGPCASIASARFYAFTFFEFVCMPCSSPCRIVPSHVDTAPHFSGI
jgi:hypothetical protein